MSLNSIDPGWKKKQIAAIAARTGFSEDEVEETLIEQLNLLMSDSDLVWNDRRPDEIVKESRADRKNVMMAHL